MLLDMQALLFNSFCHRDAWIPVGSLPNYTHINTFVKRHKAISTACSNVIGGYARTFMPSLRHLFKHIVGRMASAHGHFHPSKVLFGRTAVPLSMDGTGWSLASCFLISTSTVLHICMGGPVACAHKEVLVDVFSTLSAHVSETEGLHTFFNVTSV